MATHGAAILSVPQAPVFTLHTTYALLPVALKVCVTGESQAPNTAVVQAVELAKHTGGLSVVAASGSFSCTAAGGQPPKYHMCLTEDAQQHAQRLQSMVAMGLPAGWAAHALRLKQVRNRLFLLQF